jgi:YD repeat-containing protein
MSRVLALFLCLVLLFVSHLTAQSGTIRYIYDELGRLVGVIDGAGASAAYHYDAVGNLTSITRARAGARARPSGTRPGARPSSGSGSRQPSSNQAANKQAHDAAREAGLNREQQRKLHDAISGEGIESYADILKIAKAIKAGNWH